MGPVPIATQQVQIEKVIFGGAGLVRIYDKVCFIDGVLPGEKVEIQITSHKKSFSRGKLIRVLTPSPARTQPACMYVDRCGGCQYQHMTYEEELRIKGEQVKESLTRGLKVSESVIRPIQFHSDPYHYRNHITLHPVNEKKGNARWGYVDRDNHTVFSLEHCPIAKPALEAAFKLEREALDPEERMTFSLAENGDILSNDSGRLYSIKIAGEKLLAHSQGFFQNNLRVSELLLEQIRLWTEKIQPKTFLDLYAGVGLFGLLAAEKVAKVLFVEESRYSVQALKENIKQIDERNSKRVIYEGKSEIIFPSIFSSLDPKETLILMDPPRSGLEPFFAQEIAKIKNLKALVYISCDLAILNRDLKLILSEGNFEISEVIPFDMFPRTKHIETAVLLRSKEA